MHLPILNTTYVYATCTCSLNVKVVVQSICRVNWNIYNIHLEVRQVVVIYFYSIFSILACMLLFVCMRCCNTEPFYKLMKYAL